MKTILVPTDYSHSAWIALQYASAIARAAGASIWLHHAFKDEAAVDHVGGESHEMAMDRHRRNLSDLIDNIKREPGNAELSITPYPSIGDVCDTIHDLTERHSIDLTVMGTRGATNMSEAFVGSNTAATLRRINAPLLVVPGIAEFNGLQDIVYASDFHFVENDNALDVLQEIASLFDSEITILNVRERTDEPHTAEEVLESSREAHLFGNDIPHHIEVIQSDNVEDGIQAFLDQHQTVDMVAMLARKHSWFTKLFKETHTERMTYYTERPLLIMQES